MFLGLPSVSGAPVDAGILEKDLWSEDQVGRWRNTSDTETKRVNI